MKIRIINWLISIAILTQICSCDYDIRIEVLGDNRVLAYTQQDNVTIASAYYTNALNQTGWTILSINTSSYFPDRLQTLHAGYLEGYLTYDLINSAYYNFLNTVLDGQEINSEQQQFITNQNQWMLEQVHKYEQKDDYWYLVDCFMIQLQGMYTGYVDAMNANQISDQPLSFNQFYYLTNMGDLEDIQNAFTKLNKTEMNCNAYVKLIDNDLVCAHSTFNIYSLMLRVYKAYDFGFHRSDTKASFQAFSSRPGDLESKDDFYILNSGLVVMETSLNNYNMSNYDYLHYDSVPCWLRVNLANRLSTNASEWAQIFSKYRSGTHNNQWIVVDYNKWKQNSTSNVIWMVEESFALYESVDLTSTLFSNGYVASYNVPYNQEIYNTTMYQEGYGYNYYNDPRAILFAEFSQNTTSTHDVMKVIRSNHNATGDPSNELSPRFDLLNNENAKTYGAIDAKVTNKQLLQHLQSYMISSPSYDGLPYFDWTNWQSVPHQGMPDVYNFDWINYQYQSHEYSFVDFQGEQAKEYKQQNNLRHESY